MDRSSPLVDWAAFSTVPRTTAPISGPPITSASTGSPAFAVCVESFDLRRIGRSVPAGYSTANAQAAQRSAAALFLRNLRDGSIDVLDAEDEPAALLEPRFGGIETRGDHLVRGAVRRDVVVHDQSLVEFLAEQGEVLEQPARIGLRDRHAVVLISVRIVQ